MTKNSALLLSLALVASCNFSRKEEAESGNSTSAQKAESSPDRASPLLIAYDANGAVLPKSDLPLLSSENLVVSDNLSFQDKVFAHVKILDRLGQVILQAEANKLDAQNRNDNQAFRSAQEDIDNVQKASLIYSAAQAQADALISDGMKLDSSGQACSKGVCNKIDPITAVFFFTSKADAIDDSFGSSDTYSKDQSDERSACNPDVKINNWSLCPLWKLLKDKPLDRISFGLLPAIRDPILKKLDPKGSGEITKLIKNPIKRPVEIVENWRDHVLPKESSNDAVKILRNPLKCTVGKLFKKC